MTQDIPNYDFVWQQGQDGEINLVYKGSDGNGINLTGYTLRMDISTIDDTKTYTVTGASLDSAGNIYINVPRSLSLSGGVFANNIEETLEFDIFLRNSDDKQRKILRGTIYYEPSETLWT